MPRVKKTKEVKKDTKQRVNLVVSADDYAAMQEQVKIGGYRSLTDLITSRCTKDEPKVNTRSEILEVELKYAREYLAKAEQDLNMYKMMWWQSQPFWKRLGKQKELPNNLK